MTLGELRRVVAGVEVEGADLVNERVFLLEAVDRSIRESGSAVELDIDTFLTAGVILAPDALPFVNVLRARLGLPAFAGFLSSPGPSAGPVRPGFGSASAMFAAASRCQPRFELRRGGRPVVTVLGRRERILLVARYLDEGEYTVSLWCACRAFPDGPEAFGRLSHYGGGLAVLRLADGTVLRCDPD